MATTFNTSFCDPLNPEVLDLGIHGKDDVLKLFNNIKWDDYLATMQGVSQDDIHYSPSFSAANTQNNAIVSISAIDPGVFYIMYFTPTYPKKLFGIQVGTSGGDLKDLNDATLETSLQAITYLVNEDLESLVKLF